MRTTSSSERTEYVRNRTLAAYHRNNPEKKEGGNRPLDGEALLNRIVGQTLPECCGSSGSSASAFASIQEFVTGTYTITLPAGYTTATVEVWGAGGGLGFGVTDTASGYAQRRSDGAYLTGVLAVVLGDILTIEVGGGGSGGQLNGSGGLGGSGGGGQGSAGDATIYAGGGGGGYSSISKNTIPCLIAGGGGGGGRTKRGGNGGSSASIGTPQVANGNKGSADTSGGDGGSTTGGAPGNDGSSATGTAGSSGQGGNGGGNFAGGGGGGYFGGGGGWSGGSGQGGGGGGSSYIDTALVNSPTFAVTPAGPYGHGGTTVGANGEPGRVRIVFS